MAPTIMHTAGFYVAWDAQNPDWELIGSIESRDVTDDDPAQRLKVCHLLLLSFDD